ncbi:MAG: AEC family transporter [Clostridia bacterium]|nr:AEC family transporter [Clostridia bacterium]
MDSLIFALSAIAPIVLMVLMGYFLKRVGMVGESFAKEANRLVFRVFMPVMLFVNIYKIKSLAGFDFAFIGYVVIALLVVFFLSIPASIMVAGQKNRRGVLVQAAVRSGYSLIGIPLANSLYGEAGAIAATLLSAAVIPLFNVLAVVSLTAIGNDGEGKVSVKKIVLDILKNPLILGIAAALVCILIRTVFERFGISFRLSDLDPLFTVLQYLAGLAIPLALLVLGAQFELSAVAALKKEIIFGTMVRVVVVPALAIGVAYIFFRDRFTPAHFATFVSVFATPVAVPSVPMVQEMGGDVVLAGQLVVWSTLASALTVFLVTFLLRLGGAF